MGRSNLWTADQIAFLREWYPHFGSYYCADALGLKRPQVKTKVDKLHLHLLPKKQRLCVTCKKGKQYTRNAGLHCRCCHLDRRKAARRAQEWTLEQWVSAATNLVRHRGTRGVCDLTTEYMVGLWNEQEGRCWYSGEPMVPPKYGAGRRPFSPSIDRIDSSKGYVKGNVVWAAFICNAGKSDLSVEDYFKVCSAVVRHQQAQRESARGTAPSL